MSTPTTMLRAVDLIEADVREAIAQKKAHLILSTSIWSIWDDMAWLMDDGKRDEIMLQHHCDHRQFQHIVERTVEPSGRITYIHHIA